MNILLKHARRGKPRLPKSLQPHLQGTTPPPVTLADRLRSGYHRVWYEAAQALRWSRGTYREAPFGEQLDLNPAQRARIRRLVARYRVKFELQHPAQTALLNYRYLDILDRARQTLRWTVPLQPSICDVGSANFAYATALHAFFKPTVLIGTEVDGHRLYCNGRSRIDYAQGHIQDLPHARYVAVDYRDYHQPASVITALYPFVTPKPLLAWRLPLSVFDPAALFARIASNLVIGGIVVMMNHSPSEAAVARSYAESTGLVCQGVYVDDAPLCSRPQPAVLSLWYHS